MNSVTITLKMVDMLYSSVCQVLRARQQLLESLTACWMRRFTKFANLELTKRPARHMRDAELPKNDWEDVEHRTYHVKLPSFLRRLHPVFLIVKLYPAADDPIPGRQTRPPPPPVLVEGNEENEGFKVEKMLNSHIHWHHLKYLVKWKGYNSGHNSWTTHYNVHAPDVVTAFCCLNPRALCQVNTATFDSISFSQADTATSWRSSRWVTASWRGGKCQGTPVSDPLCHVLQPHCSPMSDPHCASFSDVRAHCAHHGLYCVTLHLCIYHVPMFLDLAYIWQLTWWLGTV